MSGETASGRMSLWSDLVERTFTDRERSWAKPTPAPLTFRHNLATVYRAAGRLEEAIPVSFQILPSKTKHSRVTEDYLKVLS